MIKRLALAALFLSTTVFLVPLPVSADAELKEPTLAPRAIRTPRSSVVPTASPPQKAKGGTPPRQSAAIPAPPPTQVPTVAPSTGKRIAAPASDGQEAAIKATLPQIPKPVPSRGFAFEKFDKMDDAERASKVYQARQHRRAMESNLYLGLQLYDEAERKVARAIKNVSQKPGESPKQFKERLDQLSYNLLLPYQDFVRDQYIALENADVIVSMASAADQYEGDGIAPTPAAPKFAERVNAIGIKR